MAVVFFSYSHDDEELRNELEKHLSQLKHEKLITSWHDRRIVPGSEFVDAIDENLERADIVLLLVSSSFLASKYCYDIEMKRALERHKEGSARVVPVILRNCEWQAAPFGKLSALPTDGKPVVRWRDRDDAFAEIATSIRRLVDDLQDEE